MKKLKILLSAYACEPNKGSEPGVGWNWAIQLAEIGHDVWVITRANNQITIENEKNTLNRLPNLNFIYYDLPYYLRFWKKGQFGVHLYYFLWQIGIVKIAKQYDKKINFDLVHHITFVSIHQPSLLYNLNKKYVFGPVAGGDKIPLYFLKNLKLKYVYKELIRKIWNKLEKFDPIQKKNLKEANLIFTTSKSTKELIPKTYKYKSFNKIAIGIKHINNSPKNIKSDTFNILYVGNFTYLKGIHLALLAFDRVSNNSLFTLIGKGKYRKELLELQKDLGLNNINWKDWMDQDELFIKMKMADCLLFPSMRDSGGMVVLEALSFGIPVICLNLGGPGQIVTNSCGRVIDTENKSEEQVIKDIASALNEIKNNHNLIKELSQGAIKRAKEFKWEKVVKDTYSIIENELF